jgi:hypothetical protein
MAAMPSGWLESIARMAGRSEPTNGKSNTRGAQQRRRTRCDFPYLHVKKNGEPPRRPVDSPGMLPTNCRMTSASLLSALRPTLGFPHFATRHLAALLFVHEAGAQLDYGVMLRDLGLLKPVATRMVDRLILMGFVERCWNEDRRKAFTSITDKGCEFVKSLEGQ